MTSGAVKAYYSWTAKHPNEASYDVMREVKAQQGPVYVYIPWDNEAEKRQEALLASSGDGGGNNPTPEMPLYGAMVGVERRQNQFTLEDMRSAVTTHSVVPETTQSAVSENPNSTVPVPEKPKEMKSVDSAVQNTMHLLLLLTACVLSSMLLNTA